MNTGDALRRKKHLPTVWRQLGILLASPTEYLSHSSWEVEGMPVVVFEAVAGRGVDLSICSTVNLQPCFSMLSVAVTPQGPAPAG